MKPQVTKKYLWSLIQNSKQRVFEILFLYPGQEFSFSNLTKKAQVAKPHIGKILVEFEQLDFITIKKLTKIWRIKANQNNPNFIRSKMVFLYSF